MRNIIVNLLLKNTYSLIIKNLFIIQQQQYLLYMKLFLYLNREILIYREYMNKLTFF